MNQPQMLMYQVTKGRYADLIKKTVNGELLSPDERIELSQLFGDVSIIESNMVKNLGSEYTEQYKELASKYNELTNTIIDFSEKFKQVSEWFEEKSNRLKDADHLYGLVEHFILKNGLEDKYIGFLKDVAENETVDQYRGVAKEQLDFYYVKDEDFYIIDDEYGYMKEEETEEVQ